MLEKRSTRDGKNSNESLQRLAVLNKLLNCECNILVRHWNMNASNYQFVHGYAWNTWITCTISILTNNDNDKTSIHATHVQSIFAQRNTSKRTATIHPNQTTIAILAFLVLDLVDVRANHHTISTIAPHLVKFQNVAHGSFESHVRETNASPPHYSQTYHRTCKSHTSLHTQWTWQLKDHTKTVATTSAMITKKWTNNIARTSTTLLRQILRW